MTEGKDSILFVCIENSSRSQMAEGFAKKLGLNASSAGTFPSTEVNSLVVQAMMEKGVDISQGRPKALTNEMVDQATTVVLTDASLENSIPPKLRSKMKKKLVIWSVADPQGLPIEAIRMIRDQIERNVGELFRKLSAT
jgi:arsenate reductase (thioredoxin)